MYRFQRSARAQSATLVQALQFAVEANEYMRKKYPEAANPQVFTEEFGGLGTIVWTADYKDLAALDAVRAKLMSDSGYVALVEKAAGLFIEGSVHDQLLRQA